MKRMTKLFAGLLCLLIIITFSNGQVFPGKIMFTMQGNEVRCDKTKSNGNYYAYPMMFDGQILDYVDFRMKNRGKLSIITGIPGTVNAIEVPFYIYLSRNGKIVEECKMNVLAQPVHSIEIADIISSGKAGDVLIVVPATRPLGKTKIIIAPMC